MEGRREDTPDDDVIERGDAVGRPRCVVLKADMGEIEERIEPTYLLGDSRCPFERLFLTRPVSTLLLGVRAGTEGVAN